jgi:nucleoside-diphosphate-sugar epimerase
LISLSDTVDNIIRISKKDLKPGQHEVVHNYTMRISVNKITEMLGNITGNIPVAHIENPRKEAVGTLKKETETHRAVKRSHEYKNLKAQKELENLIEFASHYKKNIDASIILPKIYWKKMALANKPNRNETKKDILQLRHSWSVK